MFASPAIIAERKVCSVCGNTLEVAIGLPNLPLTGIFCKEVTKQPVQGIDQQLLVCNKCGHGQLANEVSNIYDNSYLFRSADSVSNRREISFFLSTLEKVAPGKHFNCILDIGCNDLYLLKQLKANTRIGIDPILAGVESKDITVIGTAVEDVDIGSMSPDLVICRHTLEHIYEPKAVLQKLLDAATEDTLFLFEVPNFEAMVEGFRFDQIFHQHLQYFTLASFQCLLEEVGGTYISHWHTYNAWSSLLIAFTKRSSRKDNGKVLPLFSIPAIRQEYNIFRSRISTMNDLLKSLEGTLVYGYGAGAMLPILAYHLGNDLSLLTAVLDDDPAKDGIHYGNLPLIVRYTKNVNNLDGASFLITAMSSTPPILSKLLKVIPRTLNIFLSHYVLLRELGDK